MKNFRPISLCNVIYKICSKVLANWLRIFLDEIVSDEQSAFVPGRLITDNVLVAYECVHYLKRKKGKNGACAVKVDMAKAYDRVEWNYLEEMMFKLGFHPVFIQRIMCCVTSVCFSVRVNGSLSEVFKPTKGYAAGRPCQKRRKEGPLGCRKFWTCIIGARVSYVIGTNQQSFLAKIALILWRLF